MAHRAHTCAFWNCEAPIRADHFLCYDHFIDFQEGLVDQCPGCDQYKDARYEVCLECKDKGSSRPANRKATPPRQRIESNPQWAKRDTTAEAFYVYLLKLDNGKFYAGQTRNLRVRFGEHRDNKVQSTSGRNPRLQWFTELPAREEAAKLEADMKSKIEHDEHHIRSMILRFQDNAKALNFDP